MLYYTGIGSRETPQEVLEMMVKIGAVCAKKGLILRSGGADGADKAFEEGCDKVPGLKEIYLPWKGFNDSTSYLYDLPNYHLAEEMAFKYHPNLYSCKPPVIKLMARNSYQVMGQNLKTKSSFVVCYCEYKNGVLTGGTSQALRIAQDKEIPVFNLFIKENLVDLKKFIEGC